MSQQALPPSWQHVGRHALFPESTLDDTTRFDFLANMNGYLATRLGPKVKLAYEQRVRPAFEKEKGHAPQSRHEVRKAMAGDPVYQTWSALRRNTMEMRQQAGRGLVLRQLDALVEKARALNAGDDGLQLDPAVQVPRYASAVDIHCMPGGYHTELVADDVSAAANYDCGIFATTGGMLGRYNDGGGQALAQWLKEQHPQFRPRRILDIGCTCGHNVVPLAQAFPEAEVIAVDVAAPMLRYGHARARALGVNNIVFRQANGEALDYPDAHFDLITTAMFWHESSATAMPRKLREINRLLAPGGLTAHLEQPQYHGMDVYEQFVRDWDTYNNNEPFWGVMHEYDLRRMMAAAGFDPERYFETRVRGVVDRDIFPVASAQGEDHGRAALWTMFGAWKA
ncbi:methyltransferase domain-containing protein [Stenotrophomonas sp. MYb238]|uniref:class I SAM-dependent methyltransferase n=1 Tax=Stenotrophomonas sp. MYb238 TaxID=2040281 RepID=UPI0012918243|nr:class I SAM-dependent methyltransferase [Stenotrophomonas sp. MYb238]MQP76615.1 methyltransferase domain-containing protein [Stenotrophomonas sp. MYb238]